MSERWRNSVCSTPSRKAASLTGQILIPERLPKIHANLSFDEFNAY